MCHFNNVRYGLYPQDHIPNYMLSGPSFRNLDGNAKNPGLLSIYDEQNSANLLMVTMSSIKKQCILHENICLFVEGTHDLVAAVTGNASFEKQG